MDKPLRMGVDIGGTFTDIVMLDTRNGRFCNEKVLTTPSDPSVGVLEGVQKILESNKATAKNVSQIIHGTTLVANAIIERRGAKVALVTTSGFRDILEIGTEGRYDSYDLFIDMPEPLVPRPLRFEVPERISPEGHVLTALDEEAVIAVAKEIKRSDVTAVAISLIHGFRNPVHEMRILKIFEQEIPNLVACISSDVMPEIGEYERTSTTVCNAYVLALFKSYLKRLTEGLRHKGFENDLFLMLSDGGTVHESTAASYPIRLVQSGPAGGVQATSLIGELSGEANVFCFDMGGTTAKASLIDNGKPMRSTEFEVARVYRFKRGSGLPLRVPVIEMIEIGAGGGSIAKINNLGLVQVGPESSSADPGPACYGLGGNNATVTDADLVLGYLSAESFLGGDMALDLDAATEALERNVAAPLGISVVEAAWAIHETVNESMAQAANIHALEKAQRISDYAMIPIGGAGPVHACNIALKLAVPRVISPSSAGVASALGFLVSPTSFTFVQGGVTNLNEVDFKNVQEMLAGMENKGKELLSTAGISSRNVVIENLVSMRYLGQGYNVEAAIDLEAILSSNRDSVRAVFEQAYNAQYGRIEPGVPVEIVSWRVVVSGPVPNIDLAAARLKSSGREAQKGERSVYFGPEKGFVETTIYDRYNLEPGSTFDGPSIVEERESTTVIPPGATSKIDDALNLIVNLPVLP